MPRYLQPHVLIDTAQVDNDFHFSSIENLDSHDFRTKRNVQPSFRGCISFWRSAFPFSKMLIFQDVNLPVMLVKNLPCATSKKEIKEFSGDPGQNRWL